MMSYETHDNGGRPFLVQINDKDVSVLYNDTYKSFKKGNPVITYPNCKEVFIGMIPGTRMDFFDGPEPGNSILLCLQDDSYIYIGESIRKFNTICRVTRYISPIGNN